MTGNASLNGFERIVFYINSLYPWRVMAAMNEEKCLVRCERRNSNGPSGSTWNCRCGVKTVLRRIEGKIMSVHVDYSSEFTCMREDLFLRISRAAVNVVQKILNCNQSYSVAIAVSARTDLRTSSGSRTRAATRILQS